MENTVVEKEQQLTLQFALFDLRNDLREIIQKIPSLFLILTAKGEIMLANMDFWKSLFGYDVCEMIGKQWNAFVRSQDKEFMDKLLESDFQQEMFIDQVLPWRTKKGKYRLVKWSISPLENGKMICVGNPINSEEYED